jgi:hypothetical protein
MENDKTERDRRVYWRQRHVEKLWVKGIAQRHVEKLWVKGIAQWIIFGWMDGRMNE